MGQQFLAGARLTQQQHGRIAARATPGATLDLKAGSAGANELGKAVLGLAGP
ncbi:hypothetical protein D9M71_781140 [compost metagenome]